MAGYHGRTDRRNPADLDMAFVDPSREGAGQYADGGTLYSVDYTATNPLHIRDAREFGRMWTASGADRTAGRFHGAPGEPSSSRTFMEWVRAQGYDAMVIHPEAFDTDDQDAWEQLAGTYGDPQSVILVPSAATFTPVGPDWAQQLSTRLPGGPPDLTSLVPADANRYGEPASPHVLEWARGLLDGQQYRDSTGRRVTVKVTRAGQVRHTNRASVLIFGGLYDDNDRPLGRWDAVASIHDDGTVTAQINNLHTKQRGRGVGSGWLRGFEQAMAGIGARQIRVFDASRDEHGRSFWESQGYTQQAGWDPGNLEKLL